MVKHENLQELVSNPAINYWMGPNAHAVSYLLKGGGLYNIVLACPDNLPELVNTQATDIQEMRDFFAKWDPRLKTLLSIVQETSKWRLQNSEEMKKWSYPSGKLALLGDACHATLPYLAQGAAMVVEDGAVLGALMEKLGQSATQRRSSHLREAAGRAYHTSCQGQHSTTRDLPSRRRRKAAGVRQTATP